MRSQDRLSPTQTLVAGFLRGLTALMFRIDASQLSKVPEQGPLILIANHVHIPEIPTLYTRLLPRRIRGMVMAEHVVKKKKVVGRILNLFNSIPVQRGEPSLTSLRLGLKTLEEGHMLLLDPEGRRSFDGCLQEGQPGAILLALRSGAALLPIVHYGSEHYLRNLRRLRRTELTFVVGEPFRLKSNGGPVPGELRREMTDQVMYRMARLLPPQYRGVYAELDSARQDYLVFE